MRRAALIAAALATACAGGLRRFPAREPMWRDTDLDARSVPCRPDPRKPGHRLCRPEAYESSWAWDGADNLIFRPLARFFAVDPGREAVNVNSVDEVPDSSWFVNRIGRRPVSLEEIARGPCEQTIDGDWPDGSWLIDQGKDNGNNPGFRVRLPDGRRFMLKLDLPNQPERSTGATAIAARLYHAAGWYAACDTVVYLKPSALALTPGLTITNNQGITRPLDRAELERLLRDASRRGDRIRVAASAWLPGRTLGPFTYAGTVDDDPGDVIPHEDRRDLRGARVIAAWLNHFDSREQNSMRVWISDDKSDPDASPGRVLHYYMDLGDCFGSAWSPDALWRRIGHSYYLDFGDILQDLVTFGAVERAWERASLTPGGEIFGYFSAKNFQPDRWKGGYPNPAFERMTERDGAWAARILARFSEEQIAAAVGAGDFTDPRHTAYLVAQLVARRDAILRRWFARLSPIADVRVDGTRLCAVDLARRSRLWPESMFRYHAGGLPVAVGEGGELCVALPPADGYRVVEIRNGQAPGALRVYLWGSVLAGLERTLP